MDKKYYVYQLKTNDDEIFYIGKGCGKRMYKHQQIAKGNSINKKKNPKLYNKINFVIDNGGYIITDVLFESLDESECHTKEVELIKQIGLENLCNLTAGGEGTSGYKLSDETRRKMSEAKKQPRGKYNLTEVQREAKRKQFADNKKKVVPYWLNKEMPDDIKKKMSDAKKGKPKGTITEKRRLAIIAVIKRKKLEKLL